MAILKEIINRRSVRSYKKDLIFDQTILEIIKAAQFAPSANHLRPVEFIIVKNPETREHLFKLVGQDFVKEAPVLIIPVGDTQKSNFCTEDMTLCTSHIFLQATSMGLGTVWKNITDQQKKEIKKLLNIPDRYTLINLIPIGYPFEKTVPHDDSEFEAARIHQEKF